MENVLDVNDLSVSFDTPRGELEAVRGVSFSLAPGEILAIVGESGCGKSVLCRSILRLLPKNSYIKSGNISVHGTDITRFGQHEMEKLRRRMFSMILQDPLSSLNPTVTIGKQIAESVKISSPGIKRRDIRPRVISLMELAGLTESEKCFSMYPHQLSGGMLQRAVIATALAAEPEILLADEPTTALDVTVQAQILNLLDGIRKKSNTSIILVTHDLSVAAGIADRTAVMYAGKIVEIGKVEEIFYDPRHPYTWGLLRSLPYFAEKGEKLHAIPGIPPSMIKPPAGDAFAYRNVYALAIDYEEEPPMFQISDTHFAATWFLDRRAPKIDAPIGGVARV